MCVLGVGKQLAGGGVVSSSRRWGRTDSTQGERIWSSFQRQKVERELLLLIHILWGKQLKYGWRHLPVVPLSAMYCKTIEKCSIPHPPNPFQDLSKHRQILWSVEFSLLKGAWQKVLEGSEKDTEKSGRTTTRRRHESESTEDQLAANWLDHYTFSKEY